MRGLNTFLNYQTGVSWLAPSTHQGCASKSPLWGLIIANNVRLITVSQLIVPIHTIRWHHQHRGLKITEHQRLSNPIPTSVLPTFIRSIILYSIIELPCMCLTLFTWNVYFETTSYHGMKNYTDLVMVIRWDWQRTCGNSLYTYYRQLILEEKKP